MNCGCGISFMKPSCDAVHLDRLPQEGMVGMLYVIGDTEEAAVYVWDGSKFVAVSGGGSTVIASGTFAGNNAYNITVPLGKKMAQTDFVFAMYLPDETEIPYVNDSSSVLITNAYVCIPKQISKIDLSEDNDTIRFKGGYVYNVNNEGVITQVSKAGTVAAAAEIQGTSSTWGIFGNGTNPSYTMVTMKRDSSGFAMKLNRNAWQSKFKSGFTYNWKVVYFGTDPTNDIVEVP